jgi:hypothetical protein
MDKHGTWNIKTKDKLNNLIRNNNIINCIKAQRLSWFGHVDRMKNDGMIKNYMSVNRYLQDWQEDQKLDGKTI